MTKMTHKHVDAIIHAETCIHRCIQPALSPRCKTEMEKDLTLLTEVKNFLYHIIANPGLPYGNENNHPSNR